MDSALFSVSYLQWFERKKCAVQKHAWRLVLLFLFTTPLFSPMYPQSAPPGVPSKKGEDLFDRVIANQKKSEEALEIYEHVERVEIRKTGNDSSPAETKVWRVFPAGPARDKIPLTAEGNAVIRTSYREELQKLEKYLVWTMQQGEAQKEAYAKAERKRKERNDLIAATHEAFLFTRTGEETRGERVLTKYSMVPNPKYKATSRSTTIFTKVRGYVWVDEESGELGKVEGVVTDDITLGLFLAKIYKGSSFMQERYEIEPGVWFPTFERYDFDGRKFLMPFSIHERTFYTKFRRVGPPKESLELVRTELGKQGTAKDQ